MRGAVLNGSVTFSELQVVTAEVYVLMRLFYHFSYLVSRLFPPGK